MRTINLTTSIAAPIQKVFELSLDIDFHKRSVSQTKEEAIGGVTSGVISLGQTVKWRGKHFGFWLTHTSLISEFVKPTFFVDRMIEGRFKSFRHEHHYTFFNGITEMKDRITYETPYGLLGHIFDKIILKRYLTKLIIKRNEHLKFYLEDT